MAHEEFRPKDMNGTLAHLVEECGEVLAAAGKTLRYGLFSANPLLPVADRETNKDWLLREMGDLQLTIASLTKLVSATTAELTRTQKYLLLMMNPFVILSPGTPEARAAEELVDMGLAHLDQYEKSPNGRRWYSLTDLGKDKAAMIREESV